MTTTFRRKCASVFLGFFYGGSLANGIEQGSEFVLGGDSTVTGWPVLITVEIACSAGLAAFLAAHSSQSIGTGLAASATILPFFLVTEQKGKKGTDLFVPFRLAEFERCPTMRSSGRSSPGGVGPQLTACVGLQKA